MYVGCISPGRFLSHSRQQYQHQHQCGLRHLEIVRTSFQSLGQNTGDKQFRKRKIWPKVTDSSQYSARPIAFGSVLR